MAQKRRLCHVSIFAQFPNFPRFMCGTQGQLSKAAPPGNARRFHEVVIRMSDVSMQYDNGVRAVKRATLRIDEGEFVFLVGPSGSGKSTLIKLLTGEVRPTAGRIVVNNYNMSTIKKREIPYLRRTLGVVFQDFRLIEKKTVYENVAFAMRAVGAKNRAIKKRVPYVLDLVGLSEKADTRPLELSGGEQQRVAIARALVNNPRLIIADEPTGNLDPVRSYELMTLFEKINELGTTILIVTHEKELVDEFEKRVIMIDGGEIVSDATGRYYADDEFYEEGMYGENGYYEEEQGPVGQTESPQEGGFFNAPLAMLFDRFSMRRSEAPPQAGDAPPLVGTPDGQAQPAWTPPANGELPEENVEEELIPAEPLVHSDQTVNPEQTDSGQAAHAGQAAPARQAAPAGQAAPEQEVPAAEQGNLAGPVASPEPAPQADGLAAFDTLVNSAASQEMADEPARPAGPGENLDMVSLDELVNRFQERLGMASPAAPPPAGEQENQADEDNQP